LQDWLEGEKQKRIYISVNKGMIPKVDEGTAKAANKYSIGIYSVCPVFNPIHSD